MLLGSGSFASHDVVDPIEVAQLQLDQHGHHNANEDDDADAHDAIPNGPEFLAHQCITINRMSMKR